MNDLHLTAKSNGAPAATSATMAARIRAFDWSKTPIGPAENWPQSLKTAVQIMLGSSYPMFVWWGESMTKFYNDAYAPMLGKRHPNALGAAAAEVWADIWPVVGPQASAVLNDGQSIWKEELLLVMERNGFTEETYFTYSYSPVLGDDGHPSGVFCAVTEDTGRVLSRRRLKTLRDLGAKAFLDAKTDEQVCSSAAQVLKENGYDFAFASIYLRSEDGSFASLAESVRIDAGSLASPETIEIGSADDVWKFTDVLTANRPLFVEDLATKFGRISAGVWAEDVSHQALVIPLAKAGVNEKPIGFLVAGLSPRLQFNDEYRGFLELAAGHIATAMANARAYQEERKRAEVLAELDRAKTTFFSNISHEFRTPLTLMLGPIEETLVTANGSLRPEDRERLEVAHRNSLRLLKLVNTLLDFSRIEAGRIQANYEPTDLSAHTTELTGVFRSAIEQAGLRLMVRCSPLPEPIYVDREMWEKIVLNLVGNAFKFTFEGDINVELRWCGDYVALSVTDTGVGIPESELPKIFDRFHRVRGAKSRSHEGTGIGLALVQELVRLHGGYVGVQSTEGAGTTFTVKIRTGTAHLPPDRVVKTATPNTITPQVRPFLEEALRWLPEKGGGHPTDSDQVAEAPRVRERILIVDDNVDMRDYLRSLLADEFVVEAAINGSAALQFVARDLPDLIICDVMMPVMDGLDLVRRLRSNERTSALPIIVLSARAGDEARADGLNSGADDYLVKPFSACELLARVRANLKMARLRRADSDRVRESEQRLLAAMRATSTGAWETDLQTGENSWGAGMAEVLGVDERLAKTEAKRWGEYIAPADRGRVLAEFTSACAGAVPLFNMDFRVTRPDGAVRWFNSRGRVVVSPSGQRKMVGIAQDITERMRAEDALRASEQFNRAMIESSRDCIKTLSLDGTLLSMNNRGGELLQLSDVSVLIGRNWTDLWDVEDRGAARSAITDAISKGVGKFSGSSVLGGQVRWWHVVITPLANAHGQTEKLLAVSRDVTDEKEAQQLLHKQSALFRNLTENAFSALCLLDTKGCLTFVNPAFERVTGYTSAEVVGKNAHELLHHHFPDGRPFPIEDCELMKACRDGFALRDHEQFFIRKDGSYFPMICSVCHLEENGTCTGALVEFRDITEIKRAQESLERRTETLEALNRVSNNLVAELDVEKIVQTVIDSACEVSNAAMGAFFYTGKNEAGDVYMLRALSGTSPEAFAQLGKRENEKLFARTFEGGGVVRIADLTELSAEQSAALKRNGSIRSYMAVPVISRSGEVLGGLFFGDFEPNVFSNEIEHALIGLAAQAAIAIDNANLYRALQRELHEHKEAEEALRENTAREHAFLEHLPVGVWFLTAEGEIAYGNPAGKEIWGGTRFVGPDQLGEYKGWRPGTGHRIAAHEWAAARAIQKGETTIDEEIDIESFDGIRKTILVSAVPVRDSDGVLLGAVVFNQDITARKTTELALARAQRDLKEHATTLEQTVAERTAKLRETIGELEAFSYSIAHDMRAPLRAMQSFSRLLEVECNESISADGQDYLRRIMTSAHRMDRLIQDVLTYSRVSRTEICLSSVNLDDLVRGILESYPHLQPPRVIVERHSLPTVLGNEAALTQCFSNLIGNSAKFVQPGVTPHIVVSAERLGAKVRVSVRDNGIGIAPEYHDQIFGIFQRLNPDYDGTGIGLAIIKKAVERMGGTLGLESEAGKGSRFWFDLPVAD